MHSDSNGDDSVLAHLVDEVAHQLESGQTIEWSKYEVLWPQYVSELRTMVPALEAMVAVGPVSRRLLDPATDEPEAALGTLGDFRLIQEIGRGGMGIVYEAEQISLSRRVAVKVLPFAAMMDSRQLQRFKNEARTAATLAHPNIVSVYSVGCERGLHYFAMQFIEGRSLAEVKSELRRLEDAGSFAKRATAGENSTESLTALGTAGSTTGQRYFKRIAAVGIAAARALDHAHQCGIVHRDVKPSNLLLDNEGKIWVADFGLASTAREADLTMTGDLVGTLRYMSPEQIRGERAVVDHRTDVYSLGVTLYELLALRQAFSSNNRHELLSAVVTLDPPRLRTMRPAIPVDLETIVSTAMQKDPAARYQTAEALAADLQRFLDNRPIKARPTRAWESAAKWVLRRPAWAGFIAVCVLASAAIIGLQFRHGVALRRALAETEGLRQSGLKREAELQIRLYSSHVAAAKQSLDWHDLKRAHEILERHRDQPSGLGGVRGPEYEYLARQAIRASPIWRMGQGNAAVLAIAASPNSKQVVSLDTVGRLRVWDAENGGLRHELQAHLGEGRALVFSPDGSRLYSSGQDREIKVFDSHRWELVRSHSEAHTRNIYALALNKDGTLLASGARDDGGVRIWNASDLTLKLEINSSPGTYGIDFSPDEHELITIHKQGILCRWSAHDGQLIERKDFGIDSGLHALVVASDIPAAFAGSSRDFVFYHQLADRVPRWPLMTESGTYSLSWAPRHKTLLMGGGDGIICRWSLGEPAFADVQSGWRQGHDDQVSGIAWMPDEEHFVTASRDGTVAMWNAGLIPLDAKRALVTGKGKLTGIAYSKDGTQVATSQGGRSACVIDLKTGGPRVKLRGAYPIGHLHFALGNQRLIGEVNSNRVGIWNSANGKLLGKVNLPHSNLKDFIVSPEGTTAAIAMQAGDGTGSITFLDLANNRLTSLMIPCPSIPLQVQFVRDASRLVVVYDGLNPELIELGPAGIERHAIERSTGTGLVAPSPDGQTLILANRSNGYVYLLDLATRQFTGRIGLTDIQSIARDVAWSPDGRLLAISTSVGNIELWHVHTLRMLYTLTPATLSAKACHVRFSGDGQTLLASLEEPDELGNSVVVLFPLGDAAAGSSP